MLTQEKGTALEEFLAADEVRAEKLLNMSAEDAAKQISAAGLEISAKELEEFGKAMKASESGELDAASLDGVSGGMLNGYPYTRNPAFPYIPWKFPRIW